MKAGMGRIKKTEEVFPLLTHATSTFQLTWIPTKAGQINNARGKKWLSPVMSHSGKGSIHPLLAFKATNLRITLSFTHYVYKAP